MNETTAPDIKFHVVRVGSGDPGTKDCDFRVDSGNHEHGAGENDIHRTVLEIPNASDDDVTDALEWGPKFNSFMLRVAPRIVFSGLIASLLGMEGTGPITVRVGVWNE